jgi:hypothetical protein
LEEILHAEKALDEINGEKTTVFPLYDRFKENIVL